MGLPVTIDNPEIVNYYTNEEERRACEEKRRENSWASALAISILGIAQIIKYGDLYSKALKWRKEINDKLLRCATAEHCYWMTETYPFLKSTFDYICALFEITPDYIKVLDAKYAAPLPALTEWANADTCYPCVDYCSPHLGIAAAKGRIGAHTSWVRTQERMAERRREVKAQGMAIVDRAAQNTSAPGRQAMTLSLNIANALVSIASSGLNSGLSTFGRGLSGLATSNGS